MGVRDEPGRYRWETLERRLIADCSPWVRLWEESVRLPGGRVVDDFYSLELADYAMVFAITDDGRVVTIWHYRHGTGRVSLGLPAGYVAEGEEPLAAARREFLEETGYEAEEWQHLGSFTVDGNRGAGRAHLYLARGLRRVAEPNSGDLEEIETELMYIDELVGHMGSGAVDTLGAAAAIGLGLHALGAAKAAPCS